MDKTIKDIKKLSNNSLKIGKKLVYYGFIPLVVILGARTVRMDLFMNQQPM
jgi:hypothetical protein